MNSDTAEKTTLAANREELEHALSEPYAFALLTWPAAIALLYFDGAGELAYRIAAGAWLAVFHLAAYGRGRGAGFGNIMLLLSGVVAVAWQAQPSAWALACLPVLLVGLNGAQRARLRAFGAAPDAPGRHAGASAGEQAAG